MTRCYNTVTMVGVRQSLTTVARMLSAMNPEEAEHFLDELAAAVEILRTRQGWPPPLWDQAVSTLTPSQEYAIDKFTKGIQEGE